MPHLGVPATVSCPRCGASNRVDAQRVRDGLPAVCGRCAATLHSSSAVVEVADSHFEEQVLASPLPVLLDVWAPWCVPCREEFPELQSLQAKFAGGGLVVLGVTAEEDPKKIARFLDKVPVSFPILQDNASTLHQAVDVEVMPSTLLLDRHGRVVKTYTGFTRERGLTEMEHDIAALIGSKS